MHRRRVLRVAGVCVLFLTLLVNAPAKEPEDSDMPMESTEYGPLQDDGSRDLYFVYADEMLPAITNYEFEQLQKKDLQWRDRRGLGIGRTRSLHKAFLSFRRDKKNDKERRGPKIWDQWGKWSPCSVTCGIGKIVRWRHCVAGGCAAGEKEAQIKTCSLPAC